MDLHAGLCLICALVTLGVTIVCSVYGKKMLKMIPFICGILSGYLLATIFTLIGMGTNVEALQIIDFSIFKEMKWLPDFTFVTAFTGPFTPAEGSTIGGYIGTIAVAYIPVAFVVFAEHLADHKNISSIIEHDLLRDPGLSRTLLGDGVGSMVGAFFGGCPNTTYGESIGCVAISGNASVVTILATAILAIVFSFVAPFVTFLSSIPSCVMGGVCIALYGFIAVSGLKMIQKVDLNENENLFVVSTILIAGVGGMALSFGQVTVTAIATALIPRQRARQHRQEEGRNRAGFRSSRERRDGRGARNSRSCRNGRTEKGGLRWPIPTSLSSIIPSSSTRSPSCATRTPP